MLNPYDHEDAEVLAESVERMVPALADLIDDARRSDEVELIYVNDNYEEFTATRDDLVERALGGKRPDLVEPIKPAADDPFLQKVRHSAFYATALEHLLRRSGIERIVLAGQVTEQCILYSALDAYVRHLDVCVAKDAVAAIDEELGRAALQMMERNMRVEMIGRGSPDK